MAELVEAKWWKKQNHEKYECLRINRGFVISREGLFYIP